jgi:hypothetical protein
VEDLQTLCYCANSEFLPPEKSLTETYAVGKYESEKLRSNCLLFDRFKIKEFLLKKANGVCVYGDKADPLEKVTNN